MKNPVVIYGASCIARGSRGPNLASPPPEMPPPYTLKTYLLLYASQHGCPLGQIEIATLSPDPRSTPYPRLHRNRRHCSKRVVRQDKPRGALTETIVRRDKQLWVLRIESLNITENRRGPTCAACPPSSLIPTFKINPSGQL